jgi:hypothetical protein
MPKTIVFRAMVIETKKPMSFIKELNKLFSKYETVKDAGYFRWDLEG